MAEAVDYKGEAEPFAALLPDGAKVALAIDGAEMTSGLSKRAFSSGSIGYGWNGKVDGVDGRRYQVSVTATVIGTKAGAETRDDILETLST